MDWSDLRNQVIRHEGYRKFPYKDTVGKLTVGYGRNLDDSGISQSEAGRLLDNDLYTARQELLRNFAWLDSLPEPVNLALVNMCFNLGITRLRGFKKMLAAIEAGDWSTAADEALDSKWAEQVGDRAKELANQIRNCKNE